MRWVVYGVFLFVTPGCHRAEPPAQESRSATQTSEAVAPAPLTTIQHDALPRAVAGVALGMSVAEAEGQLGHLTCHDSKVGYRVCSGEHSDIGDAHHLEVYVNHDRLISVSYDGPAPKSAWDTLSQLTERYGRPSLSGMRERDQSGRLHEIYGWKDDQSLYSIHFMWRDTAADNPDLVGTAVTLWDRKGYQQWEAEAHPPPPPTPAAEQSREEI